MSLSGRALLLAVFWTPAMAQVEQPWPSETTDVAFTAVDAAKLPEALRKALLGWDEFGQGQTELRGSFQVAQLDLNGDGSNEYIVQSAQRYSGGPMMFVFALRGPDFVAVAEAQGTIALGAPVNGYREIVTQARAGGGQYTRTLQRYEQDRYRVLRIRDYREAEPDGPLTLVQERVLRN